MYVCMYVSYFLNHLNTSLKIALRSNVSYFFICYFFHTLKKYIYFDVLT